MESGWVRFGPIWSQRGSGGDVMSQVGSGSLWVGFEDGRVG